MPDVYERREGFSFPDVVTASDMKARNSITISDRFTALPKIRSLVVILNFFSFSSGAVDLIIKFSSLL